MKDDMLARRSLISTLGASVAAFALGSKTAKAQGQARPFQPTRHPEDAWLDAVAGRHRSFIDASTVTGAGESLLYANNLYESNKAGYKLEDRDVTVVVCLRHFATAFAFNDAIWGKYGMLMSNMLQFTDPKTKQPPTTNLLNSADYGMALTNFGNTISAVTARGTRFAVCNMASQFFAGQLAMATGGNTNTLYNELVANRIPASTMVASGVLAVNRAQEHGYTLLTTI